MRKIKLGILDQSLVHHGSSAGEAINQTIELVKLAEKHNYNRFWVSEHHNSTFIAGSSPEILMVKLAAETKNIRIGSGGIMLPNHSTLKIAENFRMLETLFPGRIDLGMGRAPGTDRITSSMLNPSNTFSEDSYIMQLEHLQHFFEDTAATSQGALLAVPQATSIPLQWILSSSGESSLIASKFGMGLVIARFINGSAQPDIVEKYRKNFRPSSQFEIPESILSIGVLCGETEEKAREMRKYVDYLIIQFEKGKFDKHGDYQSIINHNFSSMEMERIRYNSGRVVSGTKEQVKEQLDELANYFDVDEIIVTNMAGNFDDRKRSFELLSEVLELQKA